MYNRPMGIWDSITTAATATTSAAKNASSKAMSAARQVSASVSDTTKKEKQKNAQIVTNVSNHIFDNMGKIPSPGEDMYSEMPIDVNGKKITMRILTPAGTQYRMNFMEQNIQQIRDALESKGIKPAIGNQPAMDQYNADMKELREKRDDLLRAQNLANPTHGGRKSRHRMKKRNRTHKRSNGTKKGKCKGSKGKCKKSTRKRK